ncbi:MAG: DUF2891 domain-containing protein [Leeuwenhoekiella sp.]
MSKNYLFILIFVVSCQNSPQKTETNSEENKKLSTEPNYQTPALSLEQANNLAELPLACAMQEYPNKLSQTLGDAEDLKEPSQLHPAFYGCFDWHSAVHGHWSMVYLLKRFPDLDKRETLMKLLRENISSGNIAQEVAYFQEEYNTSYERTYGWAWLLKLAEELHTWDTPLARALEKNLQPLTDLIVQNYLDFLPKLNYPIRVGEHPNTAFGLSFAYEYAKTVNNEPLKNLIEKRAKDFYLKDKNCPMTWEPGGFDFLSPCLEEMNIMRLVLSKKEFLTYLDDFLPQLKNSDYTLEVGKVSDRSDGKLVHLDGVNFSRAWNLYDLAREYPEYTHLRGQADKHLLYSLPNVVDDDYEGGHWLGTFALYALREAHKEDI